MVGLVPFGSFTILFVFFCSIFEFRFTVINNSNLQPINKVFPVNVMLRNKALVCATGRRSQCHSLSMSQYTSCDH